MAKKLLSDKDLQDFDKLKARIMAEEEKKKKKAKKRTARK